MNIDILNIYLIAINVYTFIIYAVDKHKAINDHYRISEKKLFISALIGGSAGAFLGMMICRHKTRKPLFKYGIPVILIVQIIAYARLFVAC